MVIEYVVLLAFDKNEQNHSKLICRDDFQGEAGFYFPKGYTLPRVAGLIQMAGDTNLLDSEYSSDL